MRGSSRSPRGDGAPLGASEASSSELIPAEADERMIDRGLEAGSVAGKGADIVDDTRNYDEFRCGLMLKLRREVETACGIFSSRTRLLRSFVSQRKPNMFRPFGIRYR